MQKSAKKCKKWLKVKSAKKCKKVHLHFSPPPCLQWRPVTTPTIDCRRLAINRQWLGFNRQQSGSDRWRFRSLPPAASQHFRQVKNKTSCLFRGKHCGPQIEGRRRSVRVKLRGDSALSCNSQRRGSCRFQKSLNEMKFGLGGEDTLCHVQLQCTTQAQLRGAKG